MYLQRIFEILLFFCVLCGLLSCNNEGQQTDDKLYIVATTGMIADAAANIVKDSARVEGLMGPGVDPHLYKATRSDLTKLREADIILYNGLHLEGKMGEVLEKLALQKPVFAIGEGVSAEQLIRLDEGSLDPHIWFDVSLWQQAVQYMGKKLAEVDTANTAYYLKNTEAYSIQLQKLHQWTQEKIVEIPESSRVLITAHDAFNYFGQAYHIDVKGLQGISTLSEFGLKDISTLVKFISERKIKAVFVESSVPTKSLEAVVSGVKENGHEISIGGTLYSDAMGESGTPEGEYIGMVKANVNTIVNALK